MRCGFIVAIAQRSTTYADDKRRLKTKNKKREDDAADAAREIAIPPSMPNQRKRQITSRARL